MGTIMANFNITNKKKKELNLKGFWSYPAIKCVSRDLSNPFTSYHTGIGTYPQNGDILYIEDSNNPGTYIINNNTCITVAFNAYNDVAYIVTDNQGVCTITLGSQCN